MQEEKDSKKDEKVNTFFKRRQKSNIILEKSVTQN